MPAANARRRIVYLCMWTGTSGGIQVLYEHVRLLRTLGADAMLGAHGPFRRCEWFPNDPQQTPAIDDCLATLTADDVLVTPDICIGAPQLDGVPARRIAFVQNPSLLRGRLDGCASAMVPANVLVPWLRSVSGFDGDVTVVPGFLHRELVHAPRRFTRERPRVLIVDRPDKHRGEPAAVRALLARHRGLDVTFVDRPLPRVQFTELFRTHDVYVHLSHPEGFPISVLEAFGAGCLVAGFAGRGGLEFMRDHDNCFVVADGDADSAADTLLHALASPRAELDAVLARARATACSYDEGGTLRALARVCAAPLLTAVP